MGLGFAPTWLRQVSPPPASQNHFNHWSGPRSRCCTSPQGVRVMSGERSVTSPPVYVRRRSHPPICRLMRWRRGLTDKPLPWNVVLSLCDRFKSVRHRVRMLITAFTRTLYISRSIFLTFCHL